MEKLAVLLVCSILWSGCALSTDAIVQESAATFDSRLLGAWEAADGSGRAVVTRTESNSYAIEYSDKDGSDRRFEARLGRLADRLVLDIWAASPEKGPSVYENLMLPGHLLGAIQIDDANQVRIAGLEPGPLLAALGAGEISLVHSRYGEQVVLHGTTEQLRTALGAYLVRPTALTTPDVWRRAAANAAAAAAPLPPRVAPPCLEASVWHEAGLLFRRDPHWVGADGAYSIDLGNSRTLWLFSDTWIDASGGHTRRGASMVRNSVAIQTGTDPSKSEIKFYWGQTADGRPGAFFAGPANRWFWPGHGIRLGNRLVLFFNRVRSINTGLGFESDGWNAVSIDNPDEEPSQWRVTALDTPANPLGIQVGFASVLRRGDYVYAFGSQNPVKSHPIYVARWPVSEIQRGNLQAPEWWAGPETAWVADSSPAQRWPLFENGQSELTIHYDDIAGQFLAIQTVGFGPADVDIRSASELTGPWSGPRLLHRPTEFYQPNIMIYAAKAHPQLTGAGMVLTYATNTFQFSDLLTDDEIYYPRFVKLERCRN